MTMGDCNFSASRVKPDPNTTPTCGLNPARRDSIKVFGSLVFTARKYRNGMRMGKSNSCGAQDLCVTGSARFSLNRVAGKSSPSIALSEREWANITGRTLRLTPSPCPPRLRWHETAVGVVSLLALSQTQTDLRFSHHCHFHHRRHPQRDGVD